MRDRRTGHFAGAALLVGALGLAGCSHDPGQADVPSSDATASASTNTSSAAPTPTSSPSRTLTAQEQEAVEAATAVVLAYRQTGVDLLSGHLANLNELNALVSGNQLDADLKNLQHTIADGWRADRNGAVQIVWSNPTRLDLDDSPASMEVVVCVDLTSITFTKPSGEDVAGTRGAAGYLLVRTSRNGGWKITNVIANAPDQAC